MTPAGSAPALAARPGLLRARLPNGLTVLVQEHPAAAVAAVQLWVGVGARHETGPEAGVSHFIEHLLFKGTPRRGPGVIDETISALGGDMNAATSHDFTYYHVVLPAAHARTAVDVLADVAGHAVFDGQELERERQVVLEEIRRAEDNPTSVLWRLLSRHHYSGHPYGQPVLGTTETIQAVGREAVVGYFRRHYTPERAVVVAAGRLDPAGTLALIEEHFAGWTPGGAPAVEPGPAPRSPGRRAGAEVRPLQQTYVALAWPGPRAGAAGDGKRNGGSGPGAADDVHATELLAAVLGRGRTSRLHQALRERRGLVSSIGASYYLQREAGIVLVTARTTADQRDAVEAAVLEEVRRLAADGLEPAELERARTAVEAGHAFGYETAEGLAYAYGLAETAWTLEFELTFLERVRAVTAEAVRAAAERHLRPEGLTVAVLGPGGDRA